MKYLKIEDFLTNGEIEQAAKLAKAKEICEYVIVPNQREIERKLGRPVVPMYLGYMVEYALSKSQMSYKRFESNP